MLLLPQQSTKHTMSDNHRTHREIRGAISQMCGREPRGNVARQPDPLAALISGVGVGRRTNLSAIAGSVGGRVKRESRVKRFHRWVQNERIDTDIHFLPYADALLSNPTSHTLLLVMGSSEVGRWCVTPMELVEEACHWYTKRFRIETCLPEQIGRGFSFHKSHISAPC